MLHQSIEFEWQGSRAASACSYHVQEHETAASGGCSLLPSPWDRCDVERRLQKETRAVRLAREKRERDAAEGLGSGQASGSGAAWAKAGPRIRIPAPSPPKAARPPPLRRRPFASVPAPARPAPARRVVQPPLSAVPLTAVRAPRPPRASTLSVGAGRPAPQLQRSVDEEFEECDSAKARLLANPMPALPSHRSSTMGGRRMSIFAGKNLAKTTPSKGLAAGMGRMSMGTMSALRSLGPRPFTSLAGDANYPEALPSSTAASAPPAQPQSSPTITVSRPSIGGRNSSAASVDCLQVPKSPSRPRSPASHRRKLKDSLIKSSFFHLSNVLYLQITRI